MISALPHRQIFRTRCLHIRVPSNKPRKTLRDGHSTIIDKNRLAQSAFTLDDYLHVTAGRPDPDEVIDCVKWLIDGPVISDLKSIGPLGERIEHYQRIAADVPAHPFSYIQLRKDMEPIGLTTMQEMIGEKGIVSKVEKRGRCTGDFLPWASVSCLRKTLCQCQSISAELPIEVLQR